MAKPPNQSRANQSSACPKRKPSLAKSAPETTQALTKEALQTQAAHLLDQLQKECGSNLLGIPAEAWPTARTLLVAAPELQAAFVRHIVGIYGRLGARGKRRPGSHEWFRDRNAPEGGARAAKRMMRRRLPFTEQELAEMLGEIAGMDFANFAPLLEQLVRELEKRVAEAPLSPRIRKAAGRIADELLVKDWPPAIVEDYCFPQAADRKLAGIIQRLIARPLDPANP